jgi:homogentisate 1,2-dioxygenase
VAMSVHNLTTSNKIYFRNADASELFFCHDGNCKLESIFGSIEVKPGDYISVPKGITYRWVTTGPAYLLRIESFNQRYRRPDRGLLGQQALYHEEGIVGPHFDPTLAIEKIFSGSSSIGRAID